VLLRDPCFDWGRGIARMRLCAVDRPRPERVVKLGRDPESYPICEAPRDGCFLRVSIVVANRGPHLWHTENYVLKKPHGLHAGFWYRGSNLESSSLKQSICPHHTFIPPRKLQVLPAQLLHFGQIPAGFVIIKLSLEHASRNWAELEGISQNETLKKTWRLTLRARARS